MSFDKSLDTFFFLYAVSIYHRENFTDCECKPVTYHVTVISTKTKISVHGIFLSNKYENCLNDGKLLYFVYICT